MQGEGEGGGQICKQMQSDKINMLEEGGGRGKVCKKIWRDKKYALHEIVLSSLKTY